MLLIHRTISGVFVLRSETKTETKKIMSRSSYTIRKTKKIHYYRKSTMYSSYTMNTWVTNVSFLVNLGELSLPMDSSVNIVLMQYLRWILQYYWISTMNSSYTIVYDEYIGNWCICRNKPGQTISTNILFGSIWYKTYITKFYIGRDSLPRFITMNTSVVRRILR